MIEQIQFAKLFGVARIDSLLQEMLLGGKIQVVFLGLSHKDIVSWINLHPLQICNFCPLFLHNICVFLVTVFPLNFVHQIVKFNPEKCII